MPYVRRQLLEEHLVKEKGIYVFVDTVLRVYRRRRPYHTPRHPTS